MGSRAVALVVRDGPKAEPTRLRFGLGPESWGVLHTRTGRAFFDEEPTAELLARVNAALETTGVWDELGAPFVILDAELLPWSAKAEPLLRNQYAAVGSAARMALPAAIAALDQASARAERHDGLDVNDLRDRTAARLEHANSFTDVYRRYRWDTHGRHGLQGVQLAPFQVLAAGTDTFETRDHLWHLGIADRLAQTAPDTFRRTQRTVVDTTEPASRAEGVRWWDELTASGGEGIVVKPLANLVRTRKGLVPPGLKVRGREYLRLVYGPDYTASEHMSRLRHRNVGRKRSLALREYALGLEALRRVTAGEPLWRVHEAVFAVLALESDPVDPRL